MTEEQLQEECYVWFYNSYPKLRQMLYHVNNNSETRGMGAKKRQLGVAKGVWDFNAMTECGHVFIEMKVGKNGLTPEQEEFMRKAKLFGYKYFFICRNKQEFKEVIISLYGEPTIKIN